MQCIIKFFVKSNLFSKVNNLFGIWIISETEVLHLAGGLMEHFPPNIFLGVLIGLFFLISARFEDGHFVQKRAKSSKCHRWADTMTVFLGWLLLLVHCWLNWSNQIGWCVFSFVTNSELFCLPFEEPDTIILIKENSKKNWSQLRLER